MSHFIFIVLGFLLGITISIFFIIHLYRERANKKYLARSLGGFLILVALAVVPYYVVQRSTHAPDLSTIDSRLAFDEKHKLYGDEMIFVRHEVLNDSLNYDLHFRYVSTFAKYVNNQTRHSNKPVSEFKDSYHAIELNDLYRHYKRSEDTVVSDIGHMFLSMYLYQIDYDHTMIDRHLDSVKNTEIPYYHYVRGITEYAQHNGRNYDLTESHLLASVEEGKCTPESYAALARLYRSFGKSDQLDELVYQETTSEYVPSALRRVTYFNNWDVVSYWDHIISNEINRANLFGFIAAFLITLMWLFYLRKMDLYEPEKWKYLIFTFLLSIVSMQLLYPMHDVLWEKLHYYQPSHPSSDFWYMVISIGMIEEMVKIIPVLIVLRFTKAINEPFDYILYAAVAALGFAFVENTGYFEYGGLGRIPGRGFYCCIVHMGFSATIGYGLMLAKYRSKRSKIFMFFTFFFIAAFLHGFYDFWILDWWGAQYYWVSDLVMIFMVYLLIYYTNNTLNISNFYDEKIKFKSDRLKFYLMAILIGILMIGYTIISIEYGPKAGKGFLISRSLGYSFIILYIMLSLSSLTIVRGYISPLSIPFSNLFGSRIKRQDLSGGWLQLMSSNKFPIGSNELEKTKMFDQTAQIERRFIVDDSTESYLVKLAQPLRLEGYVNDQLILIPVWDKKRLNSKTRILCDIYLFKNEELLEESNLLSKELTLIGRLFSQSVPNEIVN